MKKNTQRGFALPVAVFALVVVGVLSTTGFFMARQETRIGVANEHAGMALYLTEQGLVDVMNNWDKDRFAALSLWGDTTVTQTYSDVGSVTTQITRMTDYLYFVDATATVTQGGDRLSGASRRVGVTLRLTVADIEPPAALVTRGSIRMQGTAEVHGEDAVPNGWQSECTGPTTNKPGLITDDSTDVQVTGQASLTGTPEVQQDNSIADSTFTDFGDLDWDALKALADIRLAGGSLNNLHPDSTAAGACNTGQAFSTNWGNPENPTGACADWFPVIHITGNASIQSGGVGQGVLLVDGDLDLRGSFTFYGIIIAQGQLETQGSGNRIFGGVMAGNADFSSQSLTGGSVVTNSTCAATRAILNNAGLTRVRPLVSRSWVDLSAISGS